jgi:hypothetical protein
VFPKKALSGTPEARVALRRWQDAHPSPTTPKNPDVQVSAVPLSSVRLAKLGAVVRSDIAPAEILKQRFDSEAFVGTLYSSLTTYEFVKLEAEHRQRTRSPRLAAKTEDQWLDIVRAAQMAFAAGGLTGLSAGQLSRYSKVLTQNQKNFQAVVKVANSAVGPSESSILDGRTKVLASFVPTVEKHIDTAVSIVNIPDLCDDPIAEGSFTKHFSRSFALAVRLKVWCPTWTNPFRMCWKTFTIAGASFSIGLNIGYKVNCCGATAWGQAYAQACVTLLSISVCASCSATIVGIAGLSRVPVSGGCSYGLGLTATLECKLFGSTVFYASVPFGYTITGPCPPAGLCA